MLNGATEFPQAGSYGLLLSPRPPGSATAGWGPETGGTITGPQLVRIIRRFPDRSVLVSLPLVDGASGTRTVEDDHLIDATPLTNGESREMTELSRELTKQRVRDRKGKQARYDALRLRAVYAPLLAVKLRELAARQRQAA